MTAASGPADLLAPITIGLQTDLDASDVLYSAWASAMQSMPLTPTQRNVLVQDGKRRVAQARLHHEVVLLGSTDEYPCLARLTYGLPSASNQDRWLNWVWGTGARLVTDRTAAVPGARTTVRFDVIGYRLRSGRVQSATQLALFRHYVVSGLRAVDPEATVTSGSYAWDDAWWQVPAS